MQQASVAEMTDTVCSPPTLHLPQTAHRHSGQVQVRRFEASNV